MNISRITRVTLYSMFTISLFACGSTAYDGRPLAYSSIIDPYTSQPQMRLGRPIEGLMGDVNSLLRNTSSRKYELVVDRLTNKVDGAYSAAPVFGLDSNEPLSYATTVFSGTNIKVYAPPPKSKLFGGQQKSNCKAVRPEAKRLVIETEVSNLDQNVYLKVDGWQVYRDGSKTEAGFDRGNVYAVDVFQLSLLVLECESREVLNSQTMSIAVTHGNRDRSTYIFALVKGGAFYRDTLSEHPGYNGTKDKGLQVLMSNIGIWLGEIDSNKIQSLYSARKALQSNTQYSSNQGVPQRFEEIVVKVGYKPRKKQRHYFPKKLARSLKCNNSLNRASCSFDFYGDNMNDIKHFVERAMRASVSKSSHVSCEIMRRKPALKCSARGSSVSFDVVEMQRALYGSV